MASSFVFYEIPVHMNMKLCLYVFLVVFLWFFSVYLFVLSYYSFFVFVLLYNYYLDASLPSKERQGLDLDGTGIGRISQEYEERKQ